jgi:hypothetical protein
MSQAGSQAWAFYREVAKSRVVWTVRDDEGYPAPMTSSGQRAQPFWSSRARAERIIATVEAYSAMRPVEISWDDFCAKWIPGIVRDNQLVGVNWSGPRAKGFDLDPTRLQEAVEALIADPTLSPNRRFEAMPEAEQESPQDEPYRSSSFGLEGEVRFTPLPNESKGD